MSVGNTTLMVTGRPQTTVAAPRTSLGLPLDNYGGNVARQTFKWSDGARERLPMDWKDCLPSFKYAKLEVLTEHVCAQVMKLCRLDGAVIL
jgi:hypothetical protein